MKKRNPKSVDRLIAGLDAWLASPQNRALLLDGSTQELIDYVSGKPVSSLAPIASLSKHAWWHGKYGASRVLRDDAAGWLDIQICLNYLAWDQRTLFAAIDKKVAKSISIKAIAYVILHSLVARDDSMADWLGNRLLSHLSIGDKTVKGWDAAPLYPFALKLYAVSRNIPLDYDRPDVCPIGLYEDLLNAWESEQRFAKTLLAACDYHIEQAFDDSQKDTQDFFYALYDLFPLEILAIRRIRRDQGLPMPQLDHPLMQTKLADPPESMPKIDDALLQQVTEKVCVRFSITDPWKKTQK